MNFKDLGQRTVHYWNIGYGWQKTNIDRAYCKKCLKVEHWLKNKYGAIMSTPEDIDDYYDKEGAL